MELFALQRERGAAEHASNRLEARLHATPCPGVANAESVGSISATLHSMLKLSGR